MNEVEMSILAQQVSESDPEPGSELTMIAAKILLQHVQILKNNLPIVEQSLKDLSEGKGTEEDISNVQVLVENANFLANTEGGEHFYD